MIIINTVKIIADIQFGRSGYQEHFSSLYRPFIGLLLFGFFFFHEKKRTTVTAISFMSNRFQV